MNCKCVCRTGGKNSPLGNEDSGCIGIPLNEEADNEDVINTLNMEEGRMDQMDIDDNLSDPEALSQPVAPPTVPDSANSTSIREAFPPRVTPSRSVDAFDAEMLHLPTPIVDLCAQETVPGGLPNINVFRPSWCSPTTNYRMSTRRWM